MRGIFSILALVLVGCAGQKASVPFSAGGNSAGIVNGSDVTAPDTYSQHTVFLEMKLQDGIGFCTGSIYDSQTILTAGHCVAGATKAVIIFTTNAQNQQAVTQDQIRIVDTVAIYPKFVPEPENVKSSSDPSAAPQASTQAPPIPTLAEVEQALDAANDVDYDVALMHFQGGLPAGYSPVQLATSPSIVQPGVELHMIGFGLSKVNSETKTVNGQPQQVPVPDQSTVGQLRETQLPVGVYDTTIGMIMTDSRQTGVCSGDSGGPAFVQDSNGQLVQVGIAEAVANAYCNSVSMHTAVFPFLGWIQQTAAQLAQKSQSQIADSAY